MAADLNVVFLLDLISFQFFEKIPVSEGSGTHPMLLMPPICFFNDSEKNIYARMREYYYERFLPDITDVQDIITHRLNACLGVKFYPKGNIEKGRKNPYGLVTLEISEGKPELIKFHDNDGVLNKQITHLSDR